MESYIRPLVAGNWKMNGTSASLKEPRLLAAMLKGVKLRCDVLVCPPATLARRVKAVMRGSPVKIGGQNCHSAVSGAYTGEISAAMLKDVGCSFVILGHSERRLLAHETDVDVQRKVKAAHEAGLIAIICIGETLAEREAQETLAVLTRQLNGSLPPAGVTAQNTVIAYEPVWAIGTGLTPTPDEIAATHAHIYKELQEILGENGPILRILYGGSVKPDNSAKIAALPHVSGVLVGGASLKAVDFIGIIKGFM